MRFFMAVDLEYCKYSNHIDNDGDKIQHVGVSWFK